MNRLIGILLALALTPSLEAQTSNPVLNHIWSVGMDSSRVQQLAGSLILPHFDDSTDFAKWLPQARGKLVLVSAPPVTCRPLAEWTQYATPESYARMDTARVARQRDWANRFNV